jgi:L-rhamnose mutarotase
MNNNKIQTTISQFLLAVLFTGSLNICCEKKSEQQQLDEKIFVPVYCDVVTYAELLDAKTRDAFVDSVLKHYQITREQFQATVAAFSRDDKKWQKVMTKIVEELERREQEIAAEIDSIKAIK